MPKLDANTLVKYTGSIIEQLNKNSDQQEEEERLDRERLQREQSYKSIQEPVIKNEYDPFAHQKQPRDTYSIADYMQMRDALRDAGIVENQSELNENQVESILKMSKV